MYLRIMEIHPWSIRSTKLEKEHKRLQESLTSLGNGYMGMRGNFEETYSGDSHLGTYIGGVWFPDKTRVGWWKNGYPKYFGKAINAVNYSKVAIYVDGQEVDLGKHACTASSPSLASSSASANSSPSRKKNWRSSAGTSPPPTAKPTKYASTPSLTPT